MKKLIAKLCIYILGKLGYENRFYKDHNKNEIVITLDASGALKELKKLTYEAEKLRKELDGL